MTEVDTIVVGAGISGLALARQLMEQGRRVTVLEKSAGVGGRCATRRVGELRVDHGLPLIHGRSDALARRMASLGESWTLIPDWPHHVRGQGTPCQPQGFDSRSRRWALAEGVVGLAKELCRGTTVLTGQRVTRLQPVDGGFEVSAETEAGTRMRRARCVVLTCPVPQALELLQPLDGAPELEGVVALMKRVFLLPCLTVLAGYERPPASDWHLLLPGPESIVHSLINDSSKRVAPTQQTLVIQGSPPFSRRELESEPTRWSDALLAASAALLGDWVLQPSWLQQHAWRYARVQRGDELARPVLLRWSKGALLGLCGDAFHPAGGVEGALLSGLALARRMGDDGATAVESATPVEG